MPNVSAHYNHSQLFFDVEMRHNDQKGVDYLVISLDEVDSINKDLMLFLTPDQAERLASHILSKIQAHRANELYKIQTEYALFTSVEGLDHE